MDSGDYDKCLDIAMEQLGYHELRQRAGRGPQAGPLHRDRQSTMTEPVGAGNSREYDIIGIKMFDSRRAAGSPDR